MSNDSEIVHSYIMQLLKIVSELESLFPGRRFTLDGHLLGSIGEVLAAYYYGIELAPMSQKTHDGTKSGKSIQIKITQTNSVDIADYCDYLIVLYLNNLEGKIYEVYNGPGNVVLANANKTGNGWYNRSVLRLSKLDKTIPDEERIDSVVEIEKWSADKRNQ